MRGLAEWGDLSDEAQVRGPRPSRREKTSPPGGGPPAEQKGAGKRSYRMGRLRDAALREKTSKATNGREVERV